MGSKNGYPDQKMKSAKKKRSNVIIYILYSIVPLMSYKNQEIFDGKGI
jgi:hypothetical protein